MDLVGRQTRERLPAPLRLASDAAGMSVGAVLGAVAGLRRGKAVHPHGVVPAARLVVSGAPAAPRASRLLSVAGEHEAIVRFSRSVGLPRPLPDLLGMSLRVPDAYGRGRHQDILLVTSADLPLMHHIFLPAGDVQQRPYSSSLPYRAGAETFLIGALPDPLSPRPTEGDEFERLNVAAATGRLRFDLAVAQPRGRFQPVARLHVGRRLTGALDALRFNPWHTGGGLELAGALNRLRDYAYPLSQAAWARTERDGAERQAAADHALDLIAPSPGES